LSNTQQKHHTHRPPWPSLLSRLEQSNRM